MSWHTLHVTVGHDWVDIATAVGTIGAAIFAGAAAVVAARAASATTRLVRVESERRDEERAAKLVADVRAEYQRMPGRQNQWLLVTNNGPARATDVRLEQTGATGVNLQSVLPSALAAGQRAQVDVYLLAGNDRGTTVIHWTDERGAQDLHVAPAFVDV